jgi:hypothetical protein
MVNAYVSEEEEWQQWHTKMRGLLEVKGEVLEVF